MKKFFLILMVLCATYVSEARDIYIENIEVLSKYNSTYILGYSNVFLYKIKYVDEKRIDKVMNEIKKSGLYKDIKWELIKLDSDKSFRLEIKPVVIENYDELRLEDVVLDSFPNSKKDVFIEKLETQGVVLNSLWKDYSFFELSRKIKLALDDSLDTADGTIEVSRISIRKTSKNKIKLIVHNNDNDPLIELNKN